MYVRHYNILSVHFIFTNFSESPKKRRGRPSLLQIHGKNTQFALPFEIEDITDLRNKTMASLILRGQSSKNDE